MSIASTCDRGAGAHDVRGAQGVWGVKGVRYALCALCALCSLALLSCRANVTLEDGTRPLNVCSCWAARETEAAMAAEPGPCLRCWITTIVSDVEEGKNGLCHYDQKRCLDDPGCLAVIKCLTECSDAACTNACAAAAATQEALSLFLSWSRCFCVECSDACASYSGDAPACTAAH